MTKARDSADKAPVAALLTTNTFTGAQNTAKGPDIASAATTMDIWAAAQGNVMSVTGATATTALPAAPQAGATRTLIAGVSLPADWTGGGYTYIAGAWARTEAGAAARAVVLATARVARWEAIKAHRDKLSDEGGYKVVVGGVDKWFHSDAKSKTQQLGLVMAGAAIPPVPWKTMDGSFVTMSQTLAGQIFQAAMTQDQALFAAAESHNTAMMAAADPGAYDFSGGWPATFGG